MNAQELRFISNVTFVITNASFTTREDKRQPLVKPQHGPALSWYIRRQIQLHST